MTLFPSPLERHVASALLLLSNSDPVSPSPSSPSLGLDGDAVKLEQIIPSSFEESLSLVSSGSKSEPSSLTSDGSSKQIRTADNLRIVADVVARCQEMKFKVVRKRRSKVCWSFSDEPKVVLGLPVTESSTAESTEASCLSSTSSAASSARSSYYLTRSGMGRDQLEVHEKPKRGKMQSVHGSGSGSAYLRRQAEAILKLLSRSSSSEVRIRQQLGDSPDTSKALRMLLKQEAVKRSGTGGRLDPYIYRIA